MTRHPPSDVRLLLLISAPRSPPRVAYRPPLPWRRDFSPRIHVLFARVLSVPAFSPHASLRRHRLLLGIGCSSAAPRLLLGENGVRKWLKEGGGGAVRSHTPGTYADGGDGVTLIELK